MTEMNMENIIQRLNDRMTYYEVMRVKSLDHNQIFNEREYFGKWFATREILMDISLNRKLPECYEKVIQEEGKNVKS
jgi:hypothetical protein